MKLKFDNSLVALYMSSQRFSGYSGYIQMYTVQWGCWLLTPLERVAGLGMGTSTARGARFPVPNRSYPAEREPARSSPIHPIARLSGSERLRRSTAKILLALLYMKWKPILRYQLFILPNITCNDPENDMHITFSTTPTPTQIRAQTTPALELLPWPLSSWFVPYGLRDHFTGGQAPLRKWSFKSMKIGFTTKTGCLW